MDGQRQGDVERDGVASPGRDDVVNDDHDDLGGRPGLALWGPVGRWVFLNWPRGTWQYDLICAAIIAALFVLPGPQAEVQMEPRPGPRLAQRRAEPAPSPNLAGTIHGAWGGTAVPVAAAREPVQGWSPASLVHGGTVAVRPEVGRTEAVVDTSTTSARPLQLDADGVLREMERVGRSLESFRAGFTSTKQYALFDDREVESGTLLFLQPSYVKRMVEEPQLRIEVVSSGRAQVYVPRVKQVQLYTFDDGSTGQPRFALPGISDPVELREEYDVALQGIDGEAAERYYVLELTPLSGSDASGHWRTLRLWVPDGTWLPAHRIELVEHTGDTTRIDLHDVVRNPGLSRSDFELDLPSDVEVVRHE